jgi:DNA-binding FadR family transcriptional regulator
MPGDAAVAAVFEPVQPPTTFEETVERLGTAIRLGILGPGIRLPSERELADQLGISRSTLRQAITTLVQSGHLTSVRGRGGGTFVVQEPPLAEGSPTGPVREDWREVLDLRVAIEVGTATLAADRASDDDLALMRECVDRMAAADDFDDYRRADIRFHMAIAEASGVPRLVGLVGEVEADVSELIAHIAHPPEVLDHSNAEHARIIDALARRDAPRAVRLLRRHLDGTLHILGGLFPPGPASPRANHGGHRARR